MPSVGGSILQQGSSARHLLDVTSVREVEEVLDLCRPGGDVFFDPPVKHGRVFGLHLEGERLTLSLLTLGASMEGREWRRGTPSIRATAASSSTAGRK